MCKFYQEEEFEGLAYKHRNLLNFSCNLETLHQYLDKVILHANIPSAYMTQTTCIKGLGKWKKSCSECFKESITVMQWNICMQFRKLQRTAYSCTSSPNNMIYKKTRCKRIMMDIILQKKLHIPNEFCVKISNRVI